MDSSTEERQPGGGATGSDYKKSSHKEMEVDDDELKLPDHEEKPNKNAEANKKINKAKPKAPAVNCPEKIVFVLDISTGMASTSFQGRIQRNITVLQLVKKALEIFVQTKHTINPKHEFGLVLAQDDGVMWYQEFTEDIQLLVDIMADIEPSDEEEGPEFSLDQVMALLREHCCLPGVTDLMLPPPYVIRTIFIYGRSISELSISEKGLSIFNELQSSPYFFFDVLYVHEAPSEENKCQSIYNFLCELDQEEAGYILEVSRSRQRLFEQAAKLIAHPLQRTPQRDAYYGLYPCKDDSADEL